ncbi:hypothetical protein [Streptosporangium longisporum]|uniref:Uncharacterized protein n=1 Tax=Streptosporangium longisporum TaxID=46187 RepID=A0ABP6L3Z4_9ACTN
MSGWIVLAEVFPTFAVAQEHLPGKHDQKSHGSWARKQAGEKPAGRASAARRSDDDATRSREESTWDPDTDPQEVEGMIIDLVMVLDPSKDDDPLLLQAQQWLDQVRSSRDPSTWPTPAELAAFGHTDGATTWPGKIVMAQRGSIPSADDSESKPEASSVKVGDDVELPDGMSGRVVAIAYGQAAVMRYDGDPDVIPLGDRAPKEPKGKPVKARPYEGRAKPKHIGVEDWSDKGDLIGDRPAASGGRDQRLANIWKEQGFDGLPRAVSDEELDADIAAGGIEMFRGLTGSSGRPYAEQFINGDEHFPGLGVFGNGTYTSPAAYFAATYAVTDGRGSMMRMALRSDARVIDYDKLPEAAQESENAVTDRRIADAMTDPGRLASMLGYDAIRVSHIKPHQYVILNRTAVSVSTDVKDVQG